MAIQVISDAQASAMDLVSADYTESSLEILSKNTLTTAGVLVAGSTTIAAGALVTAALPAQMLIAAGTSAALIYAGDRQDKGLSLNPWAKQDSDPVITTTAVEA